MPSQSSALTLSCGQLKLSTSTSTFLLVIVFLFALCATSCEGRHLRVVSTGKHYSSKKPSLTSRAATSYDVAEQVAGSKMDQSSVGKEVTLNAKMGLLAASSSGGVRNNTGPAVMVWQKLRHRKQKDDQGIHLDYAQPKTHAPCHN
ncbi:hypothetical protein GUJ93_ZPchr0006g40733 [Zizania palustris]|uniref:Uncharacterized protein n=1 Tax=Zizania palustris TaxID=103762 RepID=A0A8J5W1W2_ZIZPA|nr:hypothetical protein GUJ93_ZPchr0006g40733 [Zizania palustris]